jgi:TRAP-type C4-dicarboxylate transport system permease large subunit
LDSTLAIVVAGLCLAAVLAVIGLVERLARRPRATLRAKFATLFIGLVGAEAASLPALAVTIAGEDLIGLRGSGFESWMIAALYVLLTVYVIGRLFPWREIDAMASDPDATVGSVMAELKAPKDAPDDGP